MKMKFISLPFILISITFVFAQTPSKINEGPDPRYSVFGPPRPPMWEFQLSYLKEDGVNSSSFNFYKKDQRNKVLFFKMMDNGLNNRNEFRAQEVTGGTVLYPFNDDDRFQLDLGGTYDKLKSAALYSKAIYSRITYRPESNLWFRAGAEYFDGFTSGSIPGSFRKTILNSAYFAGKAGFDKISVIGLVGRGKIDDALNTRFGLAGIIEGPFNSFVLGGYIKSDQQKENVRTIAVGRWAPFRPDGLPSAVFIWKHRDNYDFQLGGIFFGNTNLFVRPAAIGMTQGMFISSAALRENSELRQSQLMTITDDYRNSDITLFYVYLKQGIEMMPGTLNHIGFRAVQVFKVFSEIEFSFLSKPVVGIFYNEETQPEFNPAIRKLIDTEISYWSFQAGATFSERFILNIISTPEKSEWKIALSFIYK